MRWNSFRDDERGASTLWNLVWFIGFGVFVGVAVDTTAAMTMKAKLQSTADAAAHAGLMSLPDPDAAIAKAVEYGDKNMDRAREGNFLREAEVEVGIWNATTRTFTPDLTAPNAVRVTTRRDSLAGNPLGTTFLRLIDFDNWDVNAVAVAALSYRQCYLDGLISASEVTMTSNNTFGDDYCVYGRTGLEFYNNNDFSGTGRGALAGVGSAAANNRCDGFDLLGRQGDQCNMDSNPGLEDGRFWSDGVYPTRTLTLTADIAALDALVLDVNRVSPEKWRKDGGKQVGDIAPWNVLSRLLTGGSYYLACESDSDILELPSRDYRNLTLITNCLLEVKGGGGATPATFEGVTLVSTSTASFPLEGPAPQIERNIMVRGANELGMGCGAGQGMSFLTPGGIQFEGANRHFGVEVTAGGEVLINGNNDAYDTFGNALTVHAAGDIHMHAQSRYRACDFTGESRDAQPFFKLVM